MRWTGWLVAGAALAGCGGKADDARNALSAATAVASGAVQESVDKAEEFRKERLARGDTVAMSYTALQEYLPSSIEGLEPSGDPTGQSQSMPGFSMSQANRTWTKASDDGNAHEVEVTLVDFGGTQQGYAMLAAPLMMGFSREDDRSKVGSVKLDLDHTAGWEELDKQSKDVKLTAVTRYRYVVTAEARGLGDDGADLVRRAVVDVARKLSDK